MDKQDQVKLSQLMLSPNMLLMIYLKSHKNNKEMNFICPCLKYMEENVWIFLTTRKNYRS